MDGASIRSGTGIATAPLNWQIAGTGDFDGDGQTDILWRDPNSGGVALWLMNGASIRSGTGIATVPLSWQIWH
jgi:hypothetical protein